MPKLIIALDIGGTKCSAAAFMDGRPGPVQQIETMRHQGAERVMARIEELISRLLKESSTQIPQAISVVCPGALAAQEGMVIHAPMLGWRNQPVCAPLSARFHCPVYLENDANAAAYGEYRAGAGQGTDSMAYITVSTGVGCGLVVNGQIVQGANGAAAELGHLHLFDQGRPCRCGRTGCLQTVASGTSIAEIASERTGIQGLTALDAANLARDGDPACIAVYEEAGDAIGRGISALNSLVDPGRIVLGGSVTAQLDLLLPAIRRRLRQDGCTMADQDAWIAKAALAPHSGLWGAALLADDRG